MEDTVVQKRTPLYAFHLEHGARFVPFGGWEMPVQYTSILQEHQAVRQAMGLFDVSHMGEAWVEGPEASKFLDYLLTNDFNNLQVGDCKYAMMCYPNGGVVDDLIVNKVSAGAYLICLNASNTEKDIAWMQEYVGAFDCTLKDVSLQYGQIALQGPKVASFVRQLGLGTLDTLGSFKGVFIELEGVNIYVTRTGYTGEDGFEFYIPSEDVLKITTFLYKQGEPLGLKLAGLGARDSLRLEAGYPLYGHELTKEITPLMANMGWVVKLKKTCDFIGKAALVRQKAEGFDRKIVFYTIDGRRIARQNASVWLAEKEVGVVVSGSMSPVLNRAIGSALVDVDALAKEEHLEVDFNGKRSSINIQKPPLHK